MRQGCGRKEWHENAGEARRQGSGLLMAEVFDVELKAYEEQVEYESDV
jgi:hypothetical protein